MVRFAELQGWSVPKGRIQNGKPPSICCAPSSGICMSITGRSAQVHKLYNFTHKEQIIFNFSMLIAEYYKTAREVSFYADKLCITPKYLTLFPR